jgi:hypothetical protein
MPPLVLFCNLKSVACALTRGLTFTLTCTRLFSLFPSLKNSNSKAWRTAVLRKNILWYYAGRVLPASVNVCLLLSDKG